MSSIFNFTLVIILIIVYYLSQNIILDNKKIVINKGSIEKISRFIDKKNYGIYFLDKIVFQFIGAPKTGNKITKNRVINRLDFLYLITTSSQHDNIKLTLIPGETKYIFLKNVAKQFNFSESKLNFFYDKYSSFKEAGIAPNTYYISDNMKEELLIKFLIRESNKFYKNLSIKLLGKYDKKEWLKYLIMASVIQKESSSIKEMVKVSSIIHNRLKIGMPLQMDGTLNYGKFSHTKITKYRIKNDKTHFNTYLNKGIPKMAISSVSKYAIIAAINPIKTDYLYFMKNIEGSHSFAKTYAEHRKNIRKFKNSKKDREK